MRKRPPSFTSIDETGKLSSAELKMIDDALDRILDGGRLAILELLGEGRSPTRLTQVFLCCRLNRARARTDETFVIKRGNPSTLQIEYQKWKTYVWPRPPHMLEPHNEILLMQFLNGSFLQLSKLAEVRPEMLEPALADLLKAWLPQLHNDRVREGEDRLPFATLSQMDVLLTPETAGRSARLTDDLLTAVEMQLRSDLDVDWATAEEIIDTERGYAVPNRIAAFLQEPRLLAHAANCNLPIGIIHGDLNFDNIFIHESAASELPRSARVGVIDYEHLRDGCLYDDLARIECELLVSTLPDTAPRGLHADTGVVAEAASASWDLRTPIPAGFTDAERAIFAALRVLREHAVEIASYTKSTDLSRFERAYYTCLLARAVSYLRYAHVSRLQRPRAFELCLLLLERLADLSAGPIKVRFPDILAGAVGSSDLIAVGPDGYYLDGTTRRVIVGAASSKLRAPANLVAEFSLEAGGLEDCEITLAQGVTTTLTESEGDLTGHGILASLDFAHGRWLFTLRPEMSADPRDSLEILWDPRSEPLRITLTFSGSNVTAQLMGGGDRTPVLSVTFRTAEQGMYFVVAGCAVRLRSFRMMGM